MKHEAKLPLFGGYALDLLLPNTTVSRLRAGDGSGLSAAQTQAEPHTDHAVRGSSFPLDTVPLLTKDTKAWAAPALKQSYGWINSQ